MKRWLAMPPENLRAPSTGNWQSATSVCVPSCGPSTCARRFSSPPAFDTDDGGAILKGLASELRTQRFVLPSAVTLERIGLAGRARARRVAAQAINDALETQHKQALMELLEHDPSLGRSRLTWLRALPHSTSAASMQGLLERLTYVRALALPRDLGEAIHPARLAKFAREGAVAPLTLLNDFGERRRVASLAAQVSELETTLTDAAIALFERFTAQLFTRSTRTRDQSWSGSKAQAGHLLRLFGGTIDAMVHAREQARDPFDVLDEMIGWERLVASREEIDTLGDLATEDPLSLAASRYVQLRRFAPAFLEAFEFDAPIAGRSLQAAVELLRDALDDKARTLGPHSWLCDIKPGAYRRWRDALARMPLAITVDTAHGAVGIVHAESPDESWARATELLEAGREVDVALLGRPAGLDADEYRRQPVAGVRALVHGHTAVSEPEWSGNRVNVHTGAGESYLDQLTLARIDVERLATTTFDVVDC